MIVSQIFNFSNQNTETGVISIMNRGTGKNINKNYIPPQLRLGVSFAVESRMI